MEEKGSLRLVNYSVCIVKASQKLTAVLIRICSSFPSFTQEVNCNTHPLGIVISICSQTLLILGNHKYMNYNIHILVEPFNLQENCKKNEAQQVHRENGFLSILLIFFGGICMWI